MLMRTGGKILGFGDLLCILVIWMADWLPDRWIWYVVLYLIVKGGLFLLLTGFKSLLSWVDLLHGAYYAFFLLTGLGNEGISFFFMAIMTAKGLWSLI